MAPAKVVLVDNIFLLPPSFDQTVIHPNSIISCVFQTSLLSLFLLALILASYVDASAKKNKKKKKGKKKKVHILSDNSTERSDTIALPSSLVSPSPSLNQLPCWWTRPTAAPAVQLEDQGILVQGVPGESQVSGRDGRTKRFEELINKKRYEEIVELGKKMSGGELLKCLCQVVTNLDHFKGLFKYLKLREMVPDFLAHGKMVLVKKVIVEIYPLKTDEVSRCNDIYDAIALSLNEGRHERVAGLFEAARGRPAWKMGIEFYYFVTWFF